MLRLRSFALKLLRSVRGKLSHSEYVDHISENTVQQIRQERIDLHIQQAQAFGTIRRQHIEQVNRSPHVDWEMLLFPTYRVADTRFREHIRLLE